MSFSYNQKDSDEYTTELVSIPNFRDVGHIVNEYCDEFRDPQ